MRPRRRDTERICSICHGKVFPGEARCRCRRVGGFAAEPGRGLGKPLKAPPGSLTAAHLYHLIKSVRSGSWASTGYIAPKNKARSDLSRTYQELGGSFSLSRRPVSTWLHKAREIAYLLWRCELRIRYEKETEWENLMSKRLILCLTGNTRQKVCDFLQIKRTELDWLDGEIGHYLGFSVPAPCRDGWEEIRQLYRKAKGGWASDVIRRRHKNYNPGQTLSYQPDNPLSSQTAPIYEGELNARNRNYARSEPEPELAYDPHYEETHPDKTDGTDAI